MRAQYIGSLTIYACITLPTWASGNPTIQENRYLVCEQPSGSTTYLPGDIVTIRKAGTELSRFSGVLTLTLASGNPERLIDASWMVGSGIFGGRKLSDSGIVRSSFLELEIKRFDIDWLEGDSTTILLKGVSKGKSFVTYTDISVGPFASQVSSFSSVCSEFTSFADADIEVQNALVRVREYDALLDAAASAAVDEAIAEATSIVDAAAEEAIKNPEANAPASTEGPRPPAKRMPNLKPKVR